jgi:hypothetical protein
MTCWPTEAHEPPGPRGLFEGLGFDGFAAVRQPLRSWRAMTMRWIWLVPS